ncbi:MAG: cell division protein FtsH, partial [Rothia sp. (in: high G+C Gram-positive bacteria)]|nr:cell division protein FtsH [Rothia sp. (in: high G+C Gram-positive bacteria)]
FAGVRKRPERGHWYSKSNREPSTLPPVKVVKAGSERADEAAESDETIVQQPTVDPMDPGNPHPGAAGPSGNPDVDPLGGPR